MSDRRPPAPARTLRGIAPIDLPALSPAPLDGVAEPMFDRLAPGDLLVDEAYQRDLSPRSLKLIRSIVERWDWLKFKPPVVALTDRGFEVVDGQHTRHRGRLPSADRHHSHRGGGRIRPGAPRPRLRVPRGRPAAGDARPGVARRRGGRRRGRPHDPQRARAGRCDAAALSADRWRLRHGRDRGARRRAAACRRARRHAGPARCWRSSPRPSLPRSRPTTSRVAEALLLDPDYAGDARCQADHRVPPRYHAEAPGRGEGGWPSPSGCRCGAR